MDRSTPSRHRFGLKPRRKLILWAIWISVAGCDGASTSKSQSIDITTDGLDGSPLGLDGGPGSARQSPAGGKGGTKGGLKATPGSGSCGQRCGSYAAGAACQCDRHCHKAHDCCADFEELCSCESHTDCASNYCRHGSCVGQTCEYLNTDCDDGDSCTVDTCQPSSGRCSSTVAADGTSCTIAYCYWGTCAAGECTKAVLMNAFTCSDGNPCTWGDSCVLRGCEGTPWTCDDENPCTSDACAPALGCTFTIISQGLTCNDEEPCTTLDTCQDGDCAGADAANGTACHDGQPCSLPGLCSGGFCVMESVKCNDGSTCTRDYCNIVSGNCQFSPLCDDGDPCTEDLCLKDGGVAYCEAKPAQNGAPCDDGDPCTAGETCIGSSCKSTSTSGCEPPVFYDDFDCGATDWQLEPKASESKPGWGVDALPSPPGAWGVGCSLNFNDNDNYEPAPIGRQAFKSAGTALSPSFFVPNGAQSQLVFRSFNGVEESPYDRLAKPILWDLRIVTVFTVDGGVPSAMASTQLDNRNALDKWEVIALPLAGLQGRKVRIRLTFDTVDASDNFGVGWFVDDMKVVQAK